MGFIIDDEFRTLIPPLTDDEFARLEKSVLAEGVREPIITWNSTIIDGHNRYRICESHGLECPNREREFASRDAAKIWIIENQFGRRNLSKYDRSALALKLKPLYEEEAKRKQVSTLKRGLEIPVSQKSDERGHIRTDERIAKIAGVSRDTIRKVEAIEQAAEAGDQKAVEVREELRSGEKKSIHGAYVAVTGKPKPRKPEDTFTKDGRRLCAMCGEPIDEGTAHACRPTVHKKCEQEYQRDWEANKKKGVARYTDDGRRLCGICGDPISPGECYDYEPGFHKKCRTAQHVVAQRLYRDASRDLRENVPTYTIESLLAQLTASAESMRRAWEQTIEINESMGVKLKAADKKRLEKAMAYPSEMLERIKESQK